MGIIIPTDHEKPDCNAYDVYRDALFGAGDILSACTPASSGEVAALDEPWTKSPSHFWLSRTFDDFCWGLSVVLLASLLRHSGSNASGVRRKPCGVSAQVSDAPTIGQSLPTLGQLGGGSPTPRGGCAHPPHNSAVRASLQYRLHPPHFSKSGYRSSQSLSRSRLYFSIIVRT